MEKTETENRLLALERTVAATIRALTDEGYLDVEEVLD